MQRSYRCARFHKSGNNKLRMKKIRHFYFWRFNCHINVLVLTNDGHISPIQNSGQRDDGDRWLRILTKHSKAHRFGPKSRDSQQFPFRRGSRPCKDVGCAPGLILRRPPTSWRPLCVWVWSDGINIVPTPLCFKQSWIKIFIVAFRRCEKVTIQILFWRLNNGRVLTTKCVIICASETAQNVQYWKVWKNLPSVKVKFRAAHLERCQGYWRILYPFFVSSMLEDTPFPSKSPQKIKCLRLCICVEIIRTLAGFLLKWAENLDGGFKMRETKYGQLAEVMEFWRPVRSAEKNRAR